MILLAMLLIAALISVASIVVITIFKPRWNWLHRVMSVALLATVALGIACGLTTGGTRLQVDNLHQEHDNILIYYTTIDTCDNEYVRFDFYRRVKCYNNQYADLVEDSESIWVGVFYPDGWQEEFGPIDFLLRDGTENDYAG